VTQTIRLTAFSHGAGCACKLSPADLRTVLSLVRGFEPATDPNLLVGFDTADDAAVYKLRDDLAIVVTTDFFTPIVDDPFDWGRIAATNALSDVYAMGGTPLLALNLVGWPREGLPFELLARVLDGGAEAARAGGCLIAGGHSIDDAEPKYGLAVVGVVDPNAVLTNAGARPGDALVLTKPIGLGVLSTAMKRDAATPAQVATAVDVMTALNAGARDAAVEVGVHAATDITGFGLLGHLRELCVASGVGARIDSGAVPVIDGVRDLLDAGMVAGGTQRNHAFVAPDVEFGSLPGREQLLLADAQTSGGLLLAVAGERADELVAACEARGTLAAAVIGDITGDGPGKITLRPNER
jgi:selenide, water dikinase